MVTYILTLIAKPGCDDELAELLKALQTELEQVEGFHSRTVYREEPGLFLDTAKAVFTAEEIERIAAQEQPGPEGAHFVIHEIWDAPEQRIRYTREHEGPFMAKMFPLVQPEHSHEFYRAI